MLPGKTYTPEDLLRMAWSRKWFILVPAVIIGAGTAIWSYSLPNKYRAQATILVVPQQVPESYVRSTVTADITERLQTIQQQIMSRTRLERIIEEFNLYAKERETMIMEDVVQRMRTQDIHIQIAGPRRGRDTSSFTVAYDSPNPRTAVLVTDRLANMFMIESRQDREVLADATNQFLQAQLADVKRKLLEHEAKREDFVRLNTGRLPAQAQSNMHLIQTTQARIQANAEGTSKDGEQLRLLETAISDATNALRDAPVPAGNTEGGTATQQLEAARAQLRGMELRLKPEHPDMVRAKRIIKELELKAEAEALDAAVTPDAVAPTAAGRAAAERLNSLKINAEEIRVRLESRKRDEARLQSLLAQYTSRLEAAPGLESEMVELTRDYATLQDQYTSLLRKSDDAQIAVNLERRQIGEQFKTIESARLPERPFSPDRARYNMLGLMIGLGIGLGLAALLEYRDTTLKTDDDIIATLALPVLAVIPAMVTSFERNRMKRRRRWLALSGSVVTALVVIAIIAWRMQLLEAWVR